MERLLRGNDLVGTLVLQVTDERQTADRRPTDERRPTNDRRPTRHDMPEHVTAAEAAELTGQSEIHIRRLIKSGDLPAFKEKRRWHIANPVCMFQSMISPSKSSGDRCCC